MSNFSMFFSPFLFVIAAIIMFVGAFFVLYHNRKTLQKTQKSGQSGEKNMQELLDQRMFLDRLDNVVVGDISNPRKMAEIDHIILCPEKILVVEGKNWRGDIRGDVNEEYWTLTTHKGDVWRRRNPVWQAERQARILSNRIPGVPVEYIVMFPNRNSKFPDGIPEGSIVTSTNMHYLKKIFHDKTGFSKEALDDAWKQLVEEEYSEAGQKRVNIYMNFLRKKQTSFPLWARMVSLGTGFALIAGLSIVFFIRYYHL